MTVNWTFHGDPYLSMIITAPFTITQVLIQQVDEYRIYGSWSGNAVPKNHRAAGILASSHETPPLEWVGRVGQIAPKTIQAGWLPGMSSQRG